MRRPNFLYVIAFFMGSLLTIGAEKPNVLLLCVDDLRPELNCFGKSYVISPNIDKLAASGRAFHRHYVQAPTCGASRYTLLTGKYGPSSNGALFARAKAIANSPDTISPSMPAWFRQNGYTTISIGKVSHHPGGRGGADWDDGASLEMPNSWDRHIMNSGKWQHPRGIMHGLANGEIRVKAGEMDVLQAAPGPDDNYPDGLITNDALKELDTLAKDKEKPFFLAVGIIRPHLPFGAPKKYLDLYKDVKLPKISHSTKPTGKTTWHKSGEFMKYNRWDKNPNEDPEFAVNVRRHYAACVTYADAQIGRILNKLDEVGATNNTIIVLWGDHGWHLGEHGIWGKHALFEESLHSPLIISHPSITAPGTPSNATVETIDIFPTLCELAKLPKPKFCHGTSLRPMLKKASSHGHAAVAYRGNAATIRTKTHRLIAHKKGDYELYDYRSPDGHTKNVAAAHPEIIKKLEKILKKRLALK